MSEFNNLFKSLETNELVTIERRTFLKKTLLTGVSLSSLAGLFQQLEAQGADIEITVYGSDPSDIERELQKRNAASLATTADNLGNAAVGLGGVAIGAGVALAETGVAVLLILDGAALVIIGIGFYFLAHLLRMIAADPPRYPYDIDEVLEDSFFVPEVLGQIQLETDKALLGNTDAVVKNIRATWDHLELWQAAREQQDEKWMDFHAERFWSSVEAFAMALSTLSENMKAALSSLESSLNLPNNQSIFDATVQLAGRRLLDVPSLQTLVSETINWDSKLFDNGVREAVRQRLQNAVLEHTSQADLRALLEDLDKGARYFASV